MRAPANPPAKPLGRLALTFVALLLATVSMTTPAKADEPSGTADGESAVVADVAGESADSASDAGHPEPSGAPTLAGYLASGMLRVSADVELVSGDDKAIEPVVGSFTADGLTYAIVGEGQVALVAISPRTLADGLAGGPAASPAAVPSGEGSGSGVPTSPSPSPEGTSSDDAEEGAEAGAAEGLVAPGPDAGADAEGDGEPVALTLPEAVSYDGTDYSLTTIGPRALAGCEAGTVVIPASAASVDQAAFEGSSVAAIEVAEGNPEYSSYDGMLFDAGLTRLLLIPEGKQGAARVPETAQEVDAHALSHSGGVASFSVDAGCAAFHSENGSLYDASDDLLWAPPGSEGAASLAASAEDASDGPPMASLGTASSAYATRGSLTLDPNGGAFRYNNGDTYGKRTVPMYLGDLILHTEAYGPEGRVKYYATEADCRNNKRTDAMARRYLHDWNGWTVTAAGTTETVPKTSVGGSKSYSTTPVTVKAQWKRSPVYEVTLDKQEGTGGTDRFYEARHWAFLLDPGHTSEDQKVSSIAPPTRPGHVFKGYYTKADGTGTQCVDADGRIVFAEAPTKDMDFFTRATTIYAKWERDPRHKVSFDPNGGTWSSAISLVATEGQAMPAFTAAKPTRTGHSFQGWYDDRAGGTQYYKADCTSARSYDKTTDTTLYARWTANTYSVALDRTGGTGGTAGPVTATFGQAMPEVEPPTRAGYRFLGYFNAQDVRYYNADGTSARDWDGGVNWTVFAHWEANVVTVHASGHPLAWSWVWRASGSDPIADRKGGDVAAGGSKQVVAAQRYYPTEGRSLVVDEVIPNSWYHFTGNAPGWTLVGFSKGSPSAAALSQGFYGEGSADLYAKWEPGIYKVALDKQGGTGGADAFWLKYAHHASSKPDGSDNIGSLASRPTRAGYSFMGYFTEPGGKGTRWVNPDGGWAIGSTACTSDTTLYALWQPNVYEVALDKQGGSGGTDRFWLKYGHWASLTEGGPDNCNPLPSLPTRAGYRFAGYFTEPGDRGRQDIGADGRLLILNTAYTSNVTLYAHWAPLTLTYQPGSGVSTVANAYERAFDASGAGHDRLVGSSSFEGAKGFQAWALWTDSRNFQVFTLPDGNPQHFQQLVPSRAGHRLVGWALNGARLEEGKFVLIHGAATLEPIWEPCIYKVALDKTGGTGGTDRFWLKYGHWASLTEGGPDNCNPLPSLPTRTGYSFAGYFTEPGGKGSCHIAADGRLLMGNTAYASNATLYARWEAVPYGISYDCAGGMLPENARGSYSIEDGFDLPAPIRYGYQFDGWDVSGVAEGGSAGPVLGAGVETVAGADGAKVTRVKAGTYGDLSCTAKWTLRYDLDVPVCDPGSVTFEADSLTGQVRVAPGTSAEGSILSYMAVPVALDSLSCEGLGADGSPDPAGGAPELEAIFGAGSASKVRFMATLGEGDAARTAKVTAGGSSAIASLAGLSIPAAASHDAPGRIPVAYGLELDSDLAIPPVRDAAPVARLAYTVSLLGAGA